MPLAPFCRPVEQLFAEINASLVWLMEATPAEVRDPLPAGVWDKSFQMQLPPPVLRRPYTSSHTCARLLHPLPSQCHSQFFFLPIHNLPV